MDGEVKERWPNIFSPSITKIQLYRHPNLSLSQGALHYLNSLLTRLLTSLVTVTPKTVQEAHEQVSRKFPEPLLTWVLEDSKHGREKGRKKPHLSMDKVNHIIKDFTGTTPDKQVSLFFAAMLEYMLLDILKLTSNYVDNISRQNTEIEDQDVKIAMFADKVLVNIFQEDEAEEDIPLLPIATADDIGDASYMTLVRNLLSDEQRYLRDLQLIIKLIKKFFTDRSDLFTEADIDLIFGNIEDIAELSMKLIVMLEEAIEMTDETNPVPLVGNCFEELAEECSFELYSDYAMNITKEGWTKHFLEILQQANINAALKSKYEGFRDIVYYVLPNLLLAPIYHCFYYFEQIQILEQNSSDEDKECFSQTVSAIAPIKPILESCAATLPKSRPSESSLRISWKGGIQAEKMKRIEESIEGWVGKTITQSCNEFIFEGDLTRVTGKKNSERRVFLLDALLVCCKSNQQRRPMPSVTMTHEYRLKERILLRKMVVEDDETNDRQFLVLDSETKYTFIAPSNELKRAWMSHLVRLQYRSYYDRMLDQLMRQEARQQPLRIPDPKDYRFAEPDSPDNLVLDSEDQVPPSIKGGTVLKLVERLTYHLYYDSGFTKTFLTTFRSFCQPHRLLDLLMERHHIPEPPPSEEQTAAFERGEIVTREDLKRFRKEYLQPIQLRVMNVLRQWLEYHWYDFESDPDLLQRVRDFVAKGRGKNMQKWVRTMSKIIAKKMDCEEETPIHLFTEDPPVVEWHLAHDIDKFTIMTLHPVEIARQLTLHEFSLYRKVKSSELVENVWTKAGKEQNSPNLLQMIHFSTTITRWVMVSILTTKNIEERTAVMSRTIEIMQVLKGLNNFNGLLEFVAAFNASAIHRLNHTKQRISDRLMEVLQSCMALCESRLKKVLDKLRSCDPPCVPFVGSFLTNILKTEEGNPHLLPNYPELLELINFGKRRMVASIMLDIQQYQNQPYNFLPVNEIQRYLTDLKPMGEMNAKEFHDHMYSLSMEIEPRHVNKPPPFPKTLTDKELKSPGITLSNKKNNKGGLYRDESRMSLMERRNSVPEEEPTPTTAPPTPDGPQSPVEVEPPPPPRPPREPVPDLVSAPPRMDASKTAFPFEREKLLKKGASIDVPERAPPPLPPKDYAPIKQVPYQPEHGFFHNEVRLPFHRPLYSPDYPTPTFTPEPRIETPNHTYPAQSALSYPDQQFFGPVDSGPPPPVPPRDPPSVPPRDPPPPSAGYDSYAGIRYVPDPTHFMNIGATPRSNAGPDVPPPVPRRNPQPPV
uniref:Son of sevenless homolog 1 n=1 Tax=Phallusia mammillata TaxID=59560 RepID=A0A6F9DUD3_9ASCI|nr:son of sevenless homolog 1 [Phallusia mammillata]